MPGVTAGSLDIQSPWSSITGAPPALWPAWGAEPPSQSSEPPPESPPSQSPGSAVAVAVGALGGAGAASGMAGSSRPR